MQRIRQQSRGSFYHQAVLILLGLITLRLWMLPIDILPAAKAQLPNSAAQRDQMIAATEQTNLALDKIYGHLKYGTINVKIADVEEPEPANKHNGARSLQGN